MSGPLPERILRPSLSDILAEKLSWFPPIRRTEEKMKHLKRREELEDTFWRAYFPSPKDVDNLKIGSYTLLVMRPLEPPPLEPPIYYAVWVKISGMDGHELASYVPAHSFIPCAEAAKHRTKEGFPIWYPYGHSSAINFHSAHVISVNPNAILLAIAAGNLK